MNLRDPGSILLISCYELGHQPLGVASPYGFLRRAGFAPDTLDIAVDPFDDAKVARARFVGISVPMHTALRLGVRVAQRVREINPHATICCYGLYAALNADYLLDHGVDFCIGGECEAPLVALAETLETRDQESGVRNQESGDSRSGATNGSGSCLLTPASLPAGVIQRGAPVRPYLQRLSFALPVRDTLPPLDKYARLEYKGQRRVV